MSIREEIFECLMPWATRPAPGEAESANLMLDEMTAEVLREAAARVMNDELPDGYTADFVKGAMWAARLLRRMAEETP